MSGASGVVGPGLSAPSAPTNLAATGGALQVSFTWTAVSGAASYNLYQGTSPGGESGTPVATGLTGTSYTLNTGLSSGTLYYFTLKAVNSGGPSPASNEVSAYTNSSLLTCLQAFYDFNSLTTDVTGNGNTLTNVNGVTQAAGIGSGKAGSFLASSAQKLTVASSLVQPNNKDFTLTGWFNQLNQTGEMDIMGTYTTGPLISMIGSALRFYIKSSASSIIWGSSLSVSTWYFFAAQYNATTGFWSLSVNSATPVLSGTSIIGANLSGNRFGLGSTNASAVGDWNGLLTSVGYWESSPGSGGMLTNSQVASLYNSGSPPPYPFQGVP
jgi:hypothetical protein